MEINIPISNKNKDSLLILRSIAMISASFTENLLPPNESYYIHII